MRCDAIGSTGVAKTLRGSDEDWPVVGEPGLNFFLLDSIALTAGPRLEGSDFRGERITDGFG